MISTEQFEVEGNVSELDIIGIVEGLEAVVTLDAFGPSTPFSAHVVRVNQAETILDNVPTYTAILHFDEEHPEIRPGMTANFVIRTGLKENILAIPLESITDRTRTSGTVRVLNQQGDTIEKEVGLGFYGDNGSVEVISGLSSGDQIVKQP